MNSDHYSCENCKRNGSCPDHPGDGSLYADGRLKRQGGRRTIRVDMGFLIDALEDQKGGGIEHHHFLDTETGAMVYLTCEELSDAESILSEGEVEGIGERERPEWQRENLELARIVASSNDGRFISIEPIDSHTGFRHMEEFTASCENEDFAERLFDALHGSRPFRRFKDVLEKNEVERKRWFSFKDAKMRELAQNWLSSLTIEGIELVPNI